MLIYPTHFFSNLDMKDAISQYLNDKISYSFCLYVCLSNLDMKDDIWQYTKDENILAS